MVQHKHRKTKVLFICKQRHIYGNKTGVSSGLLNSATFIVEMLHRIGIEAKIVDVVDNNSIDREVYLYKPTHVVIEALWVVPEKFEILHKLHPTVKWIVRLHSEIPFLSLEGTSIDWLYKYTHYKNVYIATNSKHAQRELQNQLKKHILYLPNYYPVDFNVENNNEKTDGVVHIGCFGAIRQLKNQLSQAMAAIDFANEEGLKLFFHMNVERQEGWNSDSIYKNIKSLFANNPEHKLVEHQWMSHEEFIKVIKTMDLGMQVSFTETFNIVSADFVNNDIPMIASDEVSWISCLYKANPVSIPNMVRKLSFAYRFRNIGLHYFNKYHLHVFGEKSKKIWEYTLNRHH